MQEHNIIFNASLTLFNIYLQAIPNVHAIVKYELSRAVDHKGGRSLAAPSDWVNVAAFQVNTRAVPLESTGLKPLYSSITAHCCKRLIVDVL